MIDYDDEFWQLGESLSFDFVEEKQDDYAVIVDKGCICKDCNEIYPYAKSNCRDGSFKCYGCRNSC